MAEKSSSVVENDTELRMRAEDTSWPAAGDSDGPDEKSPRSIQGWRWICAYCSMLSTTFLFALDNTIVADIQPSILEAFGHVELLPWIGVGFGLGTMTILPWGKAYGVFNIKWVYIFNILLFEVGSAICGAANSMTLLIIGRVIAGVGGCGMHSGCLTYIAVSTTMKERPMYMSGIAILWGLGSVLGPVVGGAFAISSATWRWAFYINLVIGAVFAPAYLLLFPNVDPRPGKTLAEKLKMIDWISTAVFLAGATCFTMAVSFGGTTYDWHSKQEIILWTMTGVLLLVTIAVTIYHPGVSLADRLYPAHFLTQPILFNLQLQVFLVSGIMLTMTYYIPLFFQFLRDDGPLDAGVRLLPFIFAMVFFSMINGGLMPKFGYVTPWYVAGSALVLIGSACMYSVDVNTSTSNIYGYTILVGAGSGCYLVAGFAIVQSLVPVSEIANAVGAMSIAQDLGMTVFLAISGTLYQNLSLQNIRPVLPNQSPADIADLIAGTSSQTYKNLSAAEKLLVIPEITSAMSNVWLFFTVGGALSFLASGFLWAKNEAFAYWHSKLHVILYGRSFGQHLSGARSRYWNPLIIDQMNKLNNSVISKTSKRRAGEHRGHRIK
ncbi:related to DHA14-like major facilitator; ABC transporter [Rhynchosporium agropyri]|uniref:Related to DHA14-like major facilitator ABC transporter n=1 Tax=Rhynchosporium agropyri TaxID=914238 RepID=A0A1E1L4P3_9HELO|nr:related to DHA14-like major facilitator; ABC transporter [Rhynchosporium agropyri]